MSAVNAAFSFLSFLTFVLVSIPFFWHLEAWNAGTCLYIVWTALGNLVYFVNSVVWNGNTTNWAPVWCDISTKIMVGLTIGIPAASLCINRKLYHIATIRTVVTTKADKRRDMTIDLCVAVGIPGLVMALHIIPQGHRFDIFEDIGCLPATYNTWVAYAITQAPIVILAVISGIYSIMSIVAFKRRQIELQILLSSTSTLSPNQYLRLMCLAGVEVVFTLPIALAGIVYSVNTGVQPWISWEDTHFVFSRADKYPAILWRSDLGTLVTLELSRWMVVLCGLLFFVFFGIAREARTNYHKVYVKIAGLLGFHVSSDDAEMENPNMGLPNIAPKNRVHVRKDVVSTRGSEDNLSSGLLKPESRPSKALSSPVRTLKDLPQLPSFDDIAMPVLRDPSGLLHVESLSESQCPTAVSSPAGASMKLPPEQVPSFDGMDIQALQYVGRKFDLAESQTPTAVSSPAAPQATVLPLSETPTILQPNTTRSGLTYSSIIAPDINTPPPHRPHSFPASVISYMSPPPQIIILSPPETPMFPHSSASSESMYSTSTATDASPMGGLFPFPLPPSFTPTPQLRPLSGSFLDFDTPRTASFLDFDEPASEPRVRDRLSPDNRV